MPVMYLVLTVVVGIFFFWLRRNHLVLYGVSEIIASLALMYVTYFPHGSGGFYLVGGKFVPPPFWDTVVVKAVPFFASVYAFVRGCDNIVTGLRKPNI